MGLYPARIAAPATSRSTKYSSTNRCCRSFRPLSRRRKPMVHLCAKFQFETDAHLEVPIQNIRRVPSRALLTPCDVTYCSCTGVRPYPLCPLVPPPLWSPLRIANATTGSAPSIAIFLTNRGGVRGVHLLKHFGFHAFWSYPQGVRWGYVTFLACRRPRDERLDAQQAGHGRPS